MVNRQRLLWAGFTAILATGVGFAIRGGILANWAADFGFTGTELGAIGGAGLTGFCFGIIIGGVIADKIGYGKLVVAAFLFHVISAFVTFGATKGMPKEIAYNWLYWGTFIFAVANGTLEAVANPLVATLFPENRTHYLNILHASWPAGMALGAIIGIFLGHLDWKIQLGLYLVPVLVYGIMFFGQKFPKSEASEKGLSLGEMFKDVGILGGLVICGLLAIFMSGVFTQVLGLMADAGTAEKVGPYIAYALSFALLLLIGVITKFSPGAILLFVLFVVHSLVGSVELGTDGWIQNITGIILSPMQGKILFFFTCAFMFSLRFCAHFIEKTLKLSPVGILCVCAVLACIGLNLVSSVNSFGMALVALAVYALGKTFFWPTMLAVASDRFPRTGAIAISIMGGIGMMLAGLIGGPGLGYFKDRYAAESLNKADAKVYDEYKNKDQSKFMVFQPVNGLDPTKIAVINDKVDKKANELEKAGKTDDPKATLPESEKSVLKADIEGARGTLKVDSYIPALMALIYLALLLYFKAIGGYKAVHINAPDTDATV